MMSRNQLISLLLAIALAAAGAWLWFDLLEQRMQAREQLSDAARENPMLAATLLLQGQRHPVALAATLSEIDPARLADGTLLLAQPNGLVTEAQAAALLAWVRRGNTLVTRPRWIAGAETAVTRGQSPVAGNYPPDLRLPPHPRYLSPKQGAVPDANAAVEFDPLAVRLGVRSVDAQPRPARCAPLAPPVPMATDTPKGKSAQVLGRWRSLRLVCATLPDNGHVIELDTAGVILVSLRGAATPLLADADGEALRIYAEGKGRIVMLPTNYFDNGALQQVDHAELLLYLARMNPGKPTVTIVQRLDIVRWYRALWHDYPRFLVCAALALALLLFAATRRFGPLLPSPALERRALIEHIDASGAWLWKLPGGRLLLLDAVRASVNALLARRVHALRTLGPADQCLLLARATTLPAAALDDALFAPPAPLPRDFTRQIRTLMQLRNHYER
jgi:hypothetical protein